LVAGGEAPDRRTGGGGRGDEDAVAPGVCARKVAAGLLAARQQLELPFNEQYQIISRSEIVNVAELLGPTLEVRAAGAWREDLPASDQTPKRFRADISQGAVCAAVTMGRSEKANIGRACAERPLSGETYRVFEGEYVGPRLRIGQDLNSGGARVVQVRVDSFAGRR
jgi:hypothetical protein